MTGPNGKGASSTNADAPEIHENQPLYFANVGAARKALAARAARCGCMLHEASDTHNGAFLGGHWDYSKPVPCMRSVGDMLRQLGSWH